MLNISKKNTNILASPEGDVNKQTSVLQELYLEFFGIFIPGFLLVSGICLVLFLLTIVLFNEIPLISGMIREMNSSYILWLILIISYATGAILNRKRPDVPDEISALRVWQEKKQGKPKHDNYDGIADFNELIFFNNSCVMYKLLMFVCPGMVIEHIRKKNPNAKSLIFVKYPYKNLRRYLICHGLNHLLDFIPWCGYIENESKCFRNRAIINELKNVIEFYGTKVFLSDLIRAESYIRMFTSLWYACKYLLFCLSISMIIASCSLLHQYHHEEQKTQFSQSVNILYQNNVSNTSVFCTENTNLAAQMNLLNENRYVNKIINTKLYILLLFIVLWLISLSAKRGIERPIHYLRLKEIVMILQQAYLLRAKFPRDRIWSVINARNTKFKELAKKCRYAPCKNSLFSCKCFK